MIEQALVNPAVVVFKDDDCDLGCLQQSFKASNDGLWITGKPEARLEQDLDGMRRVLERLPELGIDIDQVTRRLEDEAVEKFDKPFDKLLATLEARRAAA